MDTVDRGDSIRRRRKCERCGHRWTTIERDESAIAPIDTKAAGEHLQALQRILAPTPASGQG